MSRQALHDLIRVVPKTELHVHIEGTLEPELMFEIAERNRVRIPYPDVEAVRAAYRFTDLQSFLDIYYQAAAVLRTEQDFDDLLWAYLGRASADGVRHAEIFFDPQIHTARGIAFPVFMGGFRAAIARAERDYGITADLVLCFVRHLGPGSAAETLAEAEPHLEGVVAVGLDSTELGHPPEPYADVYSRARALGLRCTAHAGEEGPASYIRGALDTLKVERIDHGIHCVDDPALVKRLASERIPLTLCPISNVRIKQFERIDQHPLPQMMSAGLVVTINSDDPAYFGGYVADNYRAVADAFDFGVAEVAKLARNSIDASFLTTAEKLALLGEVDQVEENALQASPNEVLPRDR
ncbi:MAG: adenosine deaminase [Actinomycetota bacterium]